ncbi:hypothetical protein L1D59_04705 [Pseudoalteromonas piscicida]|uniref:hypothetical protein n=1 Tax=Pseudoalteromonas piscicida TaxID=43662 RepID=UPI001EFCA94A|nr:hypothetical protein [Pseudoalteromonas piscicida]MCG9767897.1 hypothetical protein [Pseudoalteromonas piscicida]
MTIESQLAQLQQAATEQTEASVQLANNITEGLQEIDQVKQDIAQTYQTVNQNNQALNDWQTQSGSVNLKDLNGNSHTLPTLKSLIADAQSVNPHPHVMTKAQFDALRDMRKQQYAGSGFVEWGKHNYSANNVNVNEGIWQYIAPSARNTLIMGEAASNKIAGASNTIYPVVNIDGVTHHVSRVAHTSTQSSLKFPSAPDGTKTYDSASGTVTQHSNAEAAFAAETETNKVITSRKDLVFLESWHEKIADKDVVYPLGNVQYGANNYKGIALRNNLVAQGYSAFGEWDADTKGHGVKWSSLTEPQKAIFLGEPEHNIYYDPKAKAYIQVRYRIRVVEGMGTIWSYEGRSITPQIESFLGYLGEGNRALSRIQTRGKLDDVIDWGTVSSGEYVNGYVSKNSQYEIFNDRDSSQWVPRYNQNRECAYNNLCFAIPIALVQRLNQGAYHPSYNPMGCGNFTRPDGNGITRWYRPKFSNVEPTSTVECFTLDYGNPDHMAGAPARGSWKSFGSIVGGSVNSGRPDQYNYHDTIYAGQVEDLRLSAKKLNVNVLRENEMYKAIAGKFRGKGKTLFTKFKALHKGYYRGSNPQNAVFRKGADGSAIDFYGNDFPKNTPVMVWQPATGTTLYGRISTSNSHMMLASGSHNLESGKHIHPLERVGLNQSDICYFAEVSMLPAEFDSLSWIDIVGSPENIAATFPDGVVGQWIPETPDGTSKSYSFNKKLIAPYHRCLTGDFGQTWTSESFTIEYIPNSIRKPHNTEDVALYCYAANASVSEPEANSKIRGNVGGVYASTHSSPREGNKLTSSLTELVGKATLDPAQEFAGEIKGYRLVEGKLNASYKYQPKHDEINIPAQENQSPLIKALYSVTEKNGLLYLQFHGAELKHNGTDWGDDQTIPIIDGENTKTDLNGNTVKVFCHHTLFPIGIAHNG